MEYIRMNTEYDTIKAIEKYFSFSIYKYYNPRKKFRFWQNG